MYMGSFMHRRNPVQQSSKSVNSLQATPDTSKPRHEHLQALPARSEIIQAPGVIITTNVTLVAALVSACVLVALGEPTLGGAVLAIASQLASKLTQLLKPSL